MPLTPEQAYEKYRCMDYLLSDREWLGNGIQQEILGDLWEAVKQAAEEKQLKLPLE